MEKDDKIFKELLKEGLFTNAPDNFTRDVMHSVENLETGKKSAFDFSSAYYFLIIILALISTIGVFYTLDPSLLIQLKNYTIVIFGSLLSPFVKIFSGFGTWQLAYPSGDLIYGTLFIITALLLFDRFLFGKKRSINIFV